MKTIIFVTGNSYKFAIAQKTLAGTDITLEQINLDTPEIQSTDVSEIAAFSAKWAAEKLGKPAAVTDAGYFIEALNGFPGPFVKYVNSWLTSDDYLKLMAGKRNRKIIAKVCLAYCEPGKDSVKFVSEVSGTIADAAVKSSDSTVSTMDEIFIPEGYDRVDSLLPREEMIKFWSEVENYWLDLAKYLKNT